MKKNTDISNLSIEEQNRINRSRKRLLIALICIDILLLAFIVIQICVWMQKN